MSTHTATGGLWIHLLMVALLATASACGPVYHDFSYRPNDVPTARSGLKIAIIPFVDERETKDSGSHGLAWVPGVLWATESRDQRQDPESVARTEYFYPGLVAYTLALDLAHNGVGARVDIAPPALEDYDLIIHGKLRSFEERDQVLSYGLGPASGITAIVGLPQGHRTVHLDLTYVAYDAKGETVLNEPVVRDWSDTFWDKKQAKPIMHGRVMTLREANGVFLQRLVPVLGGTPFVPERAAVMQRVRIYHARLDPELPQLLAERQRARTHAAEYAAAVDREIHRRAGFLESYRRTEDRIISDQQQIVWQRQHQILVETAQIRTLQRQTEAEHERMKNEAFHAAMRPLAGAFVAGTMPALGAAQAQGQWASPQWEMLTKDLSTALAAMPPPPPPPPDLRSVLAEIGIDSARDGSPGEMLGAISGNSIPDLRDKFLRLYATKKVPLARIRAAALGTAAPSIEDTTQ